MRWGINRAAPCFPQGLNLPQNVTIEEATTAERIAKTTYSIDCITTAYNLARVRERLGKTELAESMYKSIIDAQPHYVDGGCSHSLLQLFCFCPPNM